MRFKTVIARGIPDSFAFRLHCAELQRKAERVALLAELKAAQEAIRAHRYATDALSRLQDARCEAN